jgi:hypothetical protein
MGAVATGAAAVGGILGAVSGNDPTKQRTNSDSGIHLAAESSQGTNYRNSTAGAFNDLKRLLTQTSASDAISGSDAANNDLAKLLQQFAQGGYNPSQDTINQQYGFAQQLYAPQQTALQQAFSDQSVQANRQAAMMGRAGNDPILQAKLATEQSRQQNVLNSQIGATGMQNAMLDPEKRLGFQQQLATLRGGLATSALQNRQMLLNLGSQLSATEQNFRLARSSQYGTNTSVTPGSAGRVINGFLAGAGGGASAGSKFGGAKTPNTAGET